MNGQTSETPPAGIPPLPVSEELIAQRQNPATIVPPEGLENALGGPVVPPPPMRIERPANAGVYQPADTPPAPGRQLSSTFAAPDTDRVKVRAQVAAIREVLGLVITAIEKVEATVPPLLDQLESLSDLAKSAEGFDVAEAKGLVARLTKAIDTATAK
jgi:hypothetical protein